MWRGLARLRQWRRWPVRWWLSLVTAAIAGGTLLVLGGLLLVLIEGSLQRQLADYLRDQAVPVLERELGPQSPIPPRPTGKPNGKPSGEPTRPERGARDAAGPDVAAPAPSPETTARLRDLAPVLIREIAGRDTGVVVYDVQHRIVAASAPGARIEPWPTAPPDTLNRALAGADTERVLRQASRRTLVVLLPLQPTGGDVIGVLEIATSLELVDTLRAKIGAALGVGILLAVFVAGGIAAWVTRAALGPLDRMMRTTRRVAGGDLAARVDLKRQDEVGELGAAFDLMVSRLEAAFATQRRLVSDAAHELRTPLNGLAGTLEIVQVGLQRGDLEGARRLLGSVEGELDRMGRLVNDLLTLSSLDERSPVTIAAVPLVPVLRDIVRRARILAPDHQIVARLDRPVVVHGNRDQIERVFTNLLDNAVKYTPAGGLVEIEAQDTSAGVCTTIRDTGRGIPPEDLPRIFDRFYRADRARSRQEGGAGLGLAIVQSIVQAHAGRVEAESTPGVGTTVRVWLPRSPEPSARSEARR